MTSPETHQLCAVDGADQHAVAPDRRHVEHLRAPQHPALDGQHQLAADRKRQRLAPLVTQPTCAPTISAEFGDYNLAAGIPLMS